MQKGIVFISLCSIKIFRNPDKFLSSSLLRKRGIVASDNLRIIEEQLRDINQNLEVLE